MADAAAAGNAVDTAAFYGRAEVTHWAQSQMGTVPVPLCTKKPLEGRVWYNYQNQPGPDEVEVNWAASSVNPSIMARLLDSGATQASFTTYNSMGMISQTVDPVGRTTNYSYDTNGIDLLEVSQGNGSGQDVLSTMTYNSQHLPLTLTDPSGESTSMTYNTEGQLLTRTDAKDETTSYTYYSSGYLESVTGPIAGAVTTFSYDSAGRIHTVTDSEGYIITTAYDNNDRPLTTTYPDGTTEQIVYDNLDVSQMIDRQGRVTRERYDPIRERLQIIDPLGHTVKYTWCTCGGLSTITDSNGNVTTWNLDAEGRVTGKIYPSGATVTYTYESNINRLHSTSDERGDVTVYSYNVDNTIAGTTYSVASGVASTSNVSMTYDAVYKRLSSVTDGTGTTNYSYNSIPTNAAAAPTMGAGQLASVSVPIAGSSATIAYAYDQLGRVVSRTVDSGDEVDTTFDSLGRITGISNPLGSFSYAYIDETTRLSTVSFPSGTGLSTTYSYFDNTGDQRLEDITNFKSGSVLSKFDYTYNPVGTISTWEQQADSGTPSKYALTYDNADQLTDAEQTNSSTDATLTSNKYGYDPTGNRLSETTLNSTNVGQFNSLNQLTNYGTVSGTQTVAGTTSASAAVTVNGQGASVTSGTNFTANVPLPNGTNTVSIVAVPLSGATSTQRFKIVNSGTLASTLNYDADGNTITDESGNTYQWDALDRMTQITYPSGSSSLFAYDGLSRRTQIIEKNSSGTITSTKNFLWAGKDIIQERDSSNAVTKQFFLQGEQQTGVNYYYTRDQLGSTRELLNSSGGIVARYSYDPYGNDALVSGTNLASFQYAGYYFHQPSGLQLAIFRTYDSNTGRWLSRDPAGEIFGGFDLYEYCDDLPIDAVDSFGLRGTTAPPRVTPPSQTPPSLEPKTPGMPGVARCGAWAAILYFVFECPGDTDPTLGKLPNGTVPGSPFPPGTRDPIKFPKKMNPGRDCIGGCNPCPPNSPVWEILDPGHGGQTHWHWIIWEQDPDNCDCFSRRMTSPTKPSGA
jgi:RHS repeat-associated protein